MSNDYIRLAAAPALHHPGYPICGACDQEVRLEDSEWMCESCGTTWPANNMEADAEDATLYPFWSGEALTGPVCPNAEAWRFAGLPPDDRDARIRAHLEASDR